ncbi:MAG: lipopolysaccharide transport periplasmic protein LptA [Neptuniibacter sp.]
MKWTNLLTIPVIAMSLFSMNSMALPDDRDQPIHITADTASINEKTGITTYKGSVVITQGSILIEADHVDMYRGDEGVEKLIALGKPAHFRQQPEVDSPYSDAWGLHILYMIDEEKLTLTKQAKVIQEQDTFTGEKIIYDLAKSIVDAFGTTDNSADAEKGRVNMVIQPKSKNKE